MLSEFFRNHCFACLLKLLAEKEKKRRKIGKWIAENKEAKIIGALELS